VTPEGATNLSYAPPVGVLLPETTYLWEVHGRSTIQYGDWPAEVSQFHTGAGVSSLTLNSYASTPAAPTTGTIYLSGAPPSGGPSITLTASQSGIVQFTSPISVAGAITQLASL